MSEQETITVADVSAGAGGTDDIEPETPVELPVVDILTGRGFITGKSGSGKSNTASVVLENLLDNNFPVLIVDSDGEYYGLKEAYEILHVGADEECDIQVTADHAEKIASLALEENVPIILDVSGYLDDSDANELILETTRHLFAKEKKLKKPFLLVVEECHEYIPEKSGMGEAGKMLIKVGKRGRKHGLGIVGISQRPADVKKDFITQCDWLVWHRLTWRNDTKVVGRILGSEYAKAVEELGDGEGFLVADWSDAIRRVQFDRKRTFDAGATPGLEDFERPELKSVSGDLVSELTTISDEKARRESALADLRAELDKKNVEIEQLRQELSEARDLSRMADQFAQALLGRAEAPYRGGSGRNRNRPGEQSELYECEPGSERSEAESSPDHDEPHTVDLSQTDSQQPIETAVFASATTPETASKASEESTADQTARSTNTDRETDIVSRSDIAESAMRFAEAVKLGTRGAVIEELRSRIADLPPRSTEMLHHYRAVGETTPVDAHVAAGGDEDQQLAYSRNRPIRRKKLVRHIGQGTYAYAVPDLIRETYAYQLTDEAVDSMVQSVERDLLDTEDEKNRTGGEIEGSKTESDDPVDFGSIF